MTIPIGLSSSRGQRAFFGTGSGAERPAIILSLTMSRGKSFLCDFCHLGHPSRLKVKPSHVKGMWRL
eukprot:s8094_g3.t1